MGELSLNDSMTECVDDMDWPDQPEGDISPEPPDHQPHEKRKPSCTTAVAGWHIMPYEDARSLGRAIAGLAQEYTQVSPGRFMADVHALHLGELELMRERSNQALLKSNACWNDSVVFCLPLHASGPAIVGGQILNSGQGLVCSGHNYPELVISGSSDIACLTFSCDWMVDGVMAPDARNQVRRLLGEGQIVLPVAPLNRLRNSILRILDVARNDPDLLLRQDAQTQAQNELAAGIAEAFCGRQPNVATSRQQYLDIADAARRIALADTTKPVDVEELCRTLGVSRRHLQNCFQHSYGMSVTRMLRAIRLNKVRDQLLELHLDTDLRSIGDVAARWGFWHWSRFAKEYRDFFEELPSQTVRRGRTLS